MRQQGRMYNVHPQFDPFGSPILSLLVGLRQATASGRSLRGLKDADAPDLGGSRGRKRRDSPARYKEDLTADLAGTHNTVRVRTVADAIAFKESDAREDVFEDSEKTQGGRFNPEHQKILAEGKRKVGVDGIDRVPRENNLMAYEQASPKGVPPKLRAALPVQNP